MMHKLGLSLLSSAVMLALAGCPPPAEGEGEGEGDAAEGEGDAAEGEGDIVAEGEGDAGEGEGDAGEGEGDVVGEGEGEVVDPCIGVPDSCDADGNIVSCANVDGAAGVSVSLCIDPLACVLEGDVGGCADPADEAGGVFGVHPAIDPIDQEVNFVLSPANDVDCFSIVTDARSILAVDTYRDTGDCDATMGLELFTADGVLIETRRDDSGDSYCAGRSALLDAGTYLACATSSEVIADGYLYYALSDTSRVGRFCDDTDIEVLCEPADGTVCDVFECTVPGPVAEGGACRAGSTVAFCADPLFCKEATGLCTAIPTDEAGDATSPTPTTLPLNLTHTIVGFQNDVDCFSFTADADGGVAFATDFDFGADNGFGLCTSDRDTTLTLSLADGTVVSRNDNSAGLCSYVEAQLTAGTDYVLCVESVGGILLEGIVTTSSTFAPITHARNETCRAYQTERGCELDFACPFGTCVPDDFVGDETNPGFARMPVNETSNLIPNDVDCYHFDQVFDTTLTATTNGGGANCTSADVFTLELRANQTTMAASAPEACATLIAEVPAGGYDICVQGATRATYALSVTAQEPADTVGDIATADPFALPLNEQTFVGVNERDCYGLPGLAAGRYIFDGNRDVDGNCVGTARFTLEVFDANGVRVADGSSDCLILDVDLAAGDYFLCALGDENGARAAGDVTVRAAPFRDLQIGDACVPTEINAVCNSGLCSAGFCAPDEFGDAAHFFEQTNPGFLANGPRDITTTVLEDDIDCIRVQTGISFQQKVRVAVNGAETGTCNGNNNPIVTYRQFDNSPIATSVVETLADGCQTVLSTNRLGSFVVCVEGDNGAAVGPVTLHISGE